MGTDWSALGNLAAGLTGTVTKPGSAVDRFNQVSAGQFQEMQIQEALRKEEEKRKKAEKSKAFGSIGGTLGTLAGAALAPLTGGASLMIPAALGAAGGAIGNVAGQAIGGGGIDPRSVIQSGFSGGMGGYMGGKSAGFGAQSGYGEGNPVGPPSPVTPMSMGRSTLGAMFGNNMGGVPQFMQSRGQWQQDPRTGEYTWMPGGF